VEEGQEKGRSWLARLFGRGKVRGTEGRGLRTVPPAWACWFGSEPCSYSLSCSGAAVLLPCDRDKA
jgi:hypothetical protein